MSMQPLEAFDKMMATPRAFVRVYRLPTKLTNGYCFGGGVPITMTNVDWFEHPIGDRNDLEQFIKGKQYFNAFENFLVLSSYPDFTFVIGDIDRPQGHSGGKYA